MAVTNDTNKDKLSKDQQNIRNPNKESDMKNKPGSSTSGSNYSPSSKQDQSSKNR